MAPRLCNGNFSMLTHFPIQVFAHVCKSTNIHGHTHTRAYGHKLRLDMPSLSLPLPIFRYPPPTFAGTFGSFYMPICHNICHERQLINSLTALLGLLLLLLSLLYPPFHFVCKFPTSKHTPHTRTHAGTYTCQQGKSFIGKLPGQKQKANCSLLPGRLSKSALELV